MTLGVENLGHLKQKRSCLHDESSLGLVAEMDSVYESKKNKQLNAAEGEADFEGSALAANLCPAASLSLEIQTS